VKKCTILVLLALLTRQCILFKSIFLQETAFLNFKFSAMPVADRFFRLAIACNFFGGLTNMSWLETA